MISRIAITSILLSGLIASPSVSAEETPVPQTDEDKKVYRKFHPDGVVEFTDQPSRDSEELKMEELPTYKFAPAVPAPRLTPRPKQRTSVKADIAKLYNTLSITKPARGETIRSNNGDVDVTFNLSPGLQHYRGHKLEYLLNGKSILKTEKPQVLKNVDRGTHTLVIQVIDEKNKVLIHSDSVTFHLKRFFKPKPSSQRPPPPQDNNFDAEYDT